MAGFLGAGGGGGFRAREGEATGSIGGGNCTVGEGDWIGEGAATGVAPYAEAGCDV